jgi:3-hydroxy-9,10-secoandrosta-1,3,5(10)-triene-9,17-dione monooxygenase reductase component
MTLEEPEYVRKAFGCFATGVAVATTIGKKGEPVGITISSFNSVSLEPPLVLWSLGNDSISYDAFADAEHFAVNILARHQEDLSARFAATGQDKFAGLACKEGVYGSPILPEFSACFECSTEYRYPGGDHLIIVGRVLNFEDRGLEPLVFYRSEFCGTD